MPARAPPWGLFAVILLASPSSASAWTDAVVRTVSAHLAVAPDARATVTLAAEVHVSGGWLASFEIDGLDPDLEFLPERPAAFEHAQGADVPARVEDRGGGRIVFSFERRVAPRRGDYVATLAYRTRLASEPRDDGTIRLRWTLPAWRYGLDDVSITIDAPPGARPVNPEQDETAVRLERFDLEQGSRIVLRRVHLPRTRDWPVALDVPAARMDPALRTPPASLQPPPRRRAQGPRAEGGVVALALALALLALAKIAHVRRAERMCRVPSAALVPMDPRARAGLVVVLSAASTLLPVASDGSLACLAAVALLAIHRTSGPPGRPRLGVFRAAVAADLDRARRAVLRAALAPLDPGTVPGLFVVLAVAAAPLAALASGARPVPFEHALFVSALAAAILLGGSRRSRPEPADVALARLAALARRLRVGLDDAPRFVMRLVVHADRDGVLQQARLRIVPEVLPAGLLHLDVVRLARRGVGGWSGTVAVLAVAREGSPADRALEAAFPGTAVARTPRRVARQVPAGDLPRTLASVLRALAAGPDETSSGRAEPLAA